MALILTDKIIDKVPVQMNNLQDQNLQYIIFDIDLDIIEYFYLKDRDLYIANTNIEYLLYKTNKFKYLEIKIESTESKNQEEKYRNLISTSTKNIDKINIERGVILSFKSDVYKSIFSSLVHPDLYMHKEDVNTKVFKFVLENKKVTYKQIEENITGNTSEACNNLLFTEVLIRKNGVYQVNDVLINY